MSTSATDHGRGCAGAHPRDQPQHGRAPRVAVIARLTATSMGSRRLVLEKDLVGVRIRLRYSLRGCEHRDRQ